jgi:hypothetical protein
MVRTSRRRSSRARRTSGQTEPLRVLRPRRAGAPPPGPTRVQTLRPQASTRRTTGRILAPTPLASSLGSQYRDRRSGPWRKMSRRTALRRHRRTARAACHRGRRRSRTCSWPHLTHGQGANWARHATKQPDADVAWLLVCAGKQAPGRQCGDRCLGRTAECGGGTRSAPSPVLDLWRTSAGVDGAPIVEKQDCRLRAAPQTGSLAPACAHSPLSTGGAARGRGRHASGWRRCRADLGFGMRSHGRREHARGLAREPPGRGRSRGRWGRDRWAGTRRVPGRACGFAHVGRPSLHRSAAALDGGWGA